jgi:hypothetical protein
MTRYFSVHEALDIAEAVLFAELMTFAVLFTLTRLDGIPRSMPLVHGLLLAGGLLAARVFVELHPGSSRPAAQHRCWPKRGRNWFDLQHHWLMKQEGKPVASHFSTVDATPIWPLTGAIFKEAPRPNAARLFMRWLLEPEQQARTGTWSVRRDVPPPSGYNPVSASLPNSLELIRARCSGSAALSSKTRSRSEAGQTLAAGASIQNDSGPPQGPAGASRAP